LAFDERSLDFIRSLLDRPCTHDAPACWDSSLAATSSDTQRARLLLLILPIYQMMDAVRRHSYESPETSAPHQGHETGDEVSNAVSEMDRVV
jgi:hypothetical protein